MNSDHFRAILLRRYILVKRTWKTVLFTLFATCFFDGLAIFAQFLISTLANEDVNPITFATFPSSESSLVIVSDPGVNQTSSYQKYINLIQSIYFNDTGRKPIIIDSFHSISDVNEYMYNNTLYKRKPQIIDMGFYFSSTEINLQKDHYYPFLSNYNLTYYDQVIPETNNDQIYIGIFYNGTAGFNIQGSAYLLYSQVMVTRLKYYFKYAEDFVISTTTLWEKTLDRIFGQIGPCLITGTLVSTIPIYISQPIIDIKGEVRSYMQSCTLSVSSYWLATFFFDMIFWIINAVFAWVILIIFRIQAVLDNIFNTIYVFVMCGPSFILFVYCCSFCFATADSASRTAFILICVVMLVPIIIDIIKNAKIPVWLDWVYTFYPPLIIQRSLMAIFAYMGSMKQNLKFYFKQPHFRAHFIMMFGQSVLWAVILTIIESVRKRVIQGNVKRTFHSYTSVFENMKKKHEFTKEAKEMELRVQNAKPNEFGVRINNVSRLFFDTTGRPIPAVNSVSLGIEENSIFGFLGANGAGKTTLIKMITSLLPVSNGSIEINGIDINVFNDPTLLSICPQFNSHLCDEMTPGEHLHMYSLIYQLPKEVEREKTEKLIKELDLARIKDQPIRELSGGDIRKLTIALSFLGPAKIILLDEPTAPLDPVARHHVHEIVLSYKGAKTFMLCTHLLSEAEFLCDVISIMIKGCVYTCGSPQYLTQRFGTDFRIDLMLKNEDEAFKVDEFFAKNLPTASLIIIRRNARIYSIPSTSFALPDLFSIMQQGQDGDNGFSYFTCSSSSLERVFMELVHMSENDEVAFAKANEV